MPRRFSSRALASLALVVSIGVGALAACSSDDASDAGDASNDASDAPQSNDATQGDVADASHDASFDAVIDASLDTKGDAVGDAANDTLDDVLAADVLSADVAPIDSGLDCSLHGPNGEPTQLGCTDLYSDWPTRTISGSLRAFDPGIHLWSDGAQKSRWIYLPPGSQIDTSDMNEWVFPVGTKLWKEFRLNGLKVETRLLWKTGSSTWLRTTYAWSQDQTSATELTAGQLDVWGTGYEIPTQDDCTTCHQGHVDGVLGFEVIGLSSLHATGLTMDQLVRQGLVTQAPAAPVVIPGNATEVAALGWLHANCGNPCHSSSPNAYANFISLRMRLRTDQLGSVQATDTYTTAVNVPSDFPPDAGFDRIKPHDVDHSCIPYRDGRRDTPSTYVPPPFRTVQMPPLATHVVDDAGLQLVKDWINAMP